MIIGPNGTGKSSLVCAICLGLGYSPSLLGRAQKIGEFVKHGRDRATIEIELQARPQDHENHIVKVRITRDGDKRKWWVNNDETSLKAVQALVKELGIQVDNLCQFLPQDRVAEFAALNPVELLHHTQRAAAPEQMLHWHDQLKALRKDQRALQLQQETDQESLTNQEARQENIRADVERLKERTQIQERIQLLKKTVPFVEYTTARNQFMHHKAQRQEAIAKLKDLERTVEPTLRAVNVKQEYQDAIDVVLKERKNQLSEAEKVADEALKEIEAVDAKITSITQARTAEKEGDKKRRQEQLRIHNKVKSLEEQLESPPPAFDPDSWNSRIVSHTPAVSCQTSNYKQREREHEVRDINTKQQSIFEKLNELQQEARTKKDAYQEIEVELEQLNSQAGQQVSRLRHASEDTARAWTWIQQNAERFEKEVYGPPMIVLSVKDRRYTDLMEALFQRGDMLTITTQTRSDFKRLSDQLYGQMGLSDINIKCQTRGLMQEMQKRPNISEQQFERFGLDGWASEFLEGPEAVIAMLCNTANLHSTGIALKDVSESQYNMITESRIGSWASGKHYYRINRRAEYGPGATSTLSRDVRRAKFWSDQPVDMSMKTQLEAKRRGLVDQHRELAEEAKPLRDSKDELVQLKKDLEKEIVCIPHLYGCSY
jgi:chromosome segregation ATPase